MQENKPLDMQHDSFFFNLFFIFHRQPVTTHEPQTAEQHSETHTQKPNIYGKLQEKVSDYRSSVKP